MKTQHLALKRIAAIALLGPLTVAAQPDRPPAGPAAQPPAPAAQPRSGTTPAVPEPRRGPPGGQPPAPPRDGNSQAPTGPAVARGEPGAEDADDADAELRRELERARETLEQAARDVARLSAELADPVVDEVRRQFRTVRPRAMLGLNIEDGADGVRIVGVSPNGPAARAGLGTGDVLVAIDGERLDADGAGPPSRRLLARMRTVEPGDEVVLRVRRNGDEREHTVTARESEWLGLERRLRTLPDRIRSAPMIRGSAFGPWGTMELAPLTPDLGRYFGTEQGLLVVRAPEDDTLGLRDGDVILDIGGREPSTPEHAMRILGSFEPGETLSVTIMRDRTRQTLEVDLLEQ